MFLEASGKFFEAGVPIPPLRKAQGVSSLTALLSSRVAQERKGPPRCPGREATAFRPPCYSRLGGTVCPESSSLQVPSRLEY